MVVETSDPWCVYCGRNEATMLDHVTPPTRKGPVGSAEYQKWFNADINLVPACRDCNTRKGDKLPDELKRDEPEMWKRLAVVMLGRGVRL